MEQAYFTGLNFCDLAKNYVKNCLKYVTNVKKMFSWVLILRFFIHSTSF